MSIEVKNLLKVYGEQKAVNDISFKVGKGEIVGFLGPNGAGNPPP
jgi:ABC-2 type transport system ATP-binding protein